jgi:hypothetical protein
MFLSFDYLKTSLKTIFKKYVDTYLISSIIQSSNSSNSSNYIIKIITFNNFYNINHDKKIFLHT